MKELLLAAGYTSKDIGGYSYFQNYLKHNQINGIIEQIEHEGHIQVDSEVLKVSNKYLREFN